MKKKLLVSFGIACAVFFSAGCSDTNTDKDLRVAQDELMVIKDSVTGCEYIKPINTRSSYLPRVEYVNGEQVVRGCKGVAK